MNMISELSKQFPAMRSMAANDRTTLVEGIITTVKTLALPYQEAQRAKEESRQDATSEKQLRSIDREAKKLLEDYSLIYRAVNVVNQYGARYKAYYAQLDIYTPIRTELLARLNELLPHSDLAPWPSSPSHYNAAQQEWMKKAMYSRTGLQAIDYHLCPVCYGIYNGEDGVDFENPYCPRCKDGKSQQLEWLILPENSGVLRQLGPEFIAWDKIQPYPWLVNQVNQWESRATSAMEACLVYELRVA